MLDGLARPAALDVLRLQRIAHRAERVGEKTDFVGAHGLRDRTVEITFRDLIRGRSQVTNWPERVAGDADYNPRQHDQGDAEKRRRDPPKRALVLEKFGFI